MNYFQFELVYFWKGSKWFEFLGKHLKKQNSQPVMAGKGNGETRMNEAETIKKWGRKIS